ncbi:SusD-like starch-binding protein associating with outer membrane [Mucilaginibacter gracilis]|uniref:SusD-like starch-binding protein associating with outer membrane n=1 Tax=Mucilaginibacter gracilis TaxID=423350 RepID=A0A495IVW2_9SPHI|nr:RagB/SusD family nutrient uptake outer membrane protein [Mucilaginibacter gracilis]RKR80702.1 SusD-like starch-binding protein associating with outer membrane [Mucilaginibacter gracilis]
MNTHKTLYTVILSFLICATACKKQDDWLAAKSNLNSVIPQTTADFQALLDRTFTLNYVYATAGNVGADNSYIPDASIPLVNETERNLYSWKQTIWSGGTSPEWNDFFINIELANVALDGLAKISSDSPDYNNVKGQALFHRAMGYYTLTQLFCKAYNKTTASSDLGLPIRLTSDVNILVQRSSLQDTYNQIISDASLASQLLSATQPYLQRPVNAAADALLAKAYLNMGDYINAQTYSSAAINIHPALLDYNNSTIASPTATYRFPQYGKGNPEILFYSYGGFYSSVNPVSTSKGIVASDLYSSYDVNDLRKTLFYTVTGGNVKYRGTYSGNSADFCGLATNEVYLIRAESEARQGLTSAAMNDLNHLLINRYKTNNFTPLVAADAQTALKMILQERRKELPFVSNIRWEDLKRLNLDPVFQATLSKTISGTTYTLNPNDKLYVLPIPDTEIQISGLQQNQR